MFLSVITFYFGLLSVTAFPKQSKTSVLNVSWLLNRGIRKDNKKLSSGPSKGSCGHIIEVAGE